MSVTCGKVDNHYDNISYYQKKTYNSEKMIYF